MPKLIELKDEVVLVLTAGAVCTGKRSAANKASFLLNGSSHHAPLYLTDKLRATTNDVAAFLKGVATVIDVEPGAKAVIGGLNREAEVAYFFEEFPNSYFILLNADNDTLAARLAASGELEFPPEASESEMLEIAMQRIKADEKEIVKMQRYLLGNVFPARAYLIDTQRQKDTRSLDLYVSNALFHFGIMKADPKPPQPSSSP